MKLKSELVLFIKHLPNKTLQDVLHHLSHVSPTTLLLSLFTREETLGFHRLRNLPTGGPAGTWYSLSLTLNPQLSCFLPCRGAVGSGLESKLDDPVGYLITVN